MKKARSMNTWKHHIFRILMLIKSLQRLLKMFICEVTSAAAAAAWIFALRFLQQVRDTAFFLIHSEKKDHHIQITSSEWHYCKIFVSAVKQTCNDRCWLRSDSRFFDFIDWFCCSAAVWCHAQITAEMQSLSV